MMQQEKKSSLMRAIPIAVAFMLFAKSMGSAFAMSDAEADAELKNFASNMYAELPLRDETGGLTTIRVYSEPGRTLVLQIVDDVPANKWTDAMRSQSHQTLINNYCTNPEMSKFKRIGAKLKYMVFDRTWTYIHGTTVSPSSCN